MELTFRETKHLIHFFLYIYLDICEPLIISTIIHKLDKMSKVTRRKGIHFMFITHRLLTFFRRKKTTINIIRCFLCIHNSAVLKSEPSEPKHSVLDCNRNMM